MQLSLTQLSLMSIVMTLTVALAEIPTGIVADVYSRRFSIIIGGIFIGVCYTLIGLFPLFWVTLLAAFIEAIGDSFVSGALQAWITDEVGVERVGPVLVRSGQISTVAHWLGIVFGIVSAALYGLQIPVLMGGIGWFMLSAFLIVAMPERPKISIVPNTLSLRRHLQDAVKTFSSGTQLVRTSPVLMMLFTMQVLLLLFFDSFYRLSRAHFLRSFTLPAITLPWLGVLKENVWFGGFEALQGVFGLIGAEGVRRRVNFNQT